jgi:hypothetical protein
MIGKAKRFAAEEYLKSYLIWVGIFANNQYK